MIERMRLTVMFRQARTTGLGVADMNGRSADFSHAAISARFDRDLVRRIRNHVEQVDQMLRANHSAIDRVGSLLEKSQPTEPGKIVVRWVDVDGHPARHPGIFMLAGNELVDCHDIVSHQTQKTGGFLKHHHDTSELLRILSGLMKSREELVANLDRFNDVVTHFLAADRQNLVEIIDFDLLGQIEDRICL